MKGPEWHFRNLGKKTIRNPDFLYKRIKPTKQIHIPDMDSHEISDPPRNFITQEWIHKKTARRNTTRTLFEEFEDRLGLQFCKSQIQDPSETQIQNYQIWLKPNHPDQARSDQHQIHRDQAYH